MPTFTQIYYHIIFGTKRRRAVLSAKRRDDLYKYIWGLLNNKGCHLYRIGGIDDHVHILTSLHPSLRLERLIKDIKVASSQWIKEDAVFPGFDHWQSGYGAFTHSMAEKDRLIEYIKGQDEHHRHKTFREELIDLLQEAGIDYDEQYLDED